MVPQKHGFQNILRDAAAWNLQHVVSVSWQIAFEAPINL